MEISTWFSLQITCDGVMKSSRSVNCNTLLNFPVDAIILFVESDSEQQSVELLLKPDIRRRKLLLNPVITRVRVFCHLMVLQ